MTARPPHAEPVPVDTACRRRHARLVMQPPPSTRNRRRPGHPWWRVALAALWLTSLALGVAGQALAQTRHGSVVLLDGIINPVSERFLARAVDRAERDGAEVIVVLLDTPGGLLSSTRAMVERIFASRVPIIVYVSPDGGRAASAGTFITAAAHVAAMAPATNIGAASPISGQGEELPETLKNKVFEDTAAEIRAIAERRGRAVEPLEATVLEAKAYTASEALELGIIDLVAPNLAELLALVDGRTVLVETGEGEVSVTLSTRDLELREVRMGLFDRFLSFIADPNIAFMLLSLGGLGLFVEILNPGLIFPGTAGVIALVLAFMALGNLPGNWAGAALILLAFALIAAEVTVEGFGVLGILSIVSFVLGGVLLFVHFGTPSPVLPSIRVSLWVLAPASAVLASGVGGLVYSMVQSRRRQGPESAPPMLVGRSGVVTATLGPQGRIRVRGETWNARAADGERIERGAEVFVLGEEGALRTVERARPADETGGSETPAGPQA